MAGSALGCVAHGLMGIAADVDSPPPGSCRAFSSSSAGLPCLPAQTEAGTLRLAVGVTHRTRFFGNAGSAAGEGGGGHIRVPVP